MGGFYAVHVGVYLHRIGLQGGSQGGGGGVTAAPTQSGDLTLGGYALKPRHNGDFSILQGIQYKTGIYVQNPGLGVVIIGDNPRLPSGDGHRGEALIPKGLRHNHA